MRKRKILYAASKSLCYDLEEKIFRSIIPIQNNLLYGRLPPKVEHSFCYKLKNRTREAKEVDFGENKTIIIARRYSPHNAGHLFCETVIPIEYIFNKNNIKKENRIILFDDDVNDNSIFWFEGESKQLRDKTQELSNDFFPPMCHTVIFNIRKYLKDNYGDKGYVKFKNNILLGINKISPWDSNLWINNKIDFSLDTYVNNLYEYYRIKDIEKNTVTFFYKKGRRSVLNHKEVSIFLKKYSEKNNMDFQYHNLQDITFRDQLNILSKTKILITIGGSTSFSCYLAPTNIKFIYLPIYDNHFEHELFRKNKNKKFNLIVYPYESLLKNMIPNSLNSYNIDINILKKIL